MLFKLQDAAESLGGLGMPNTAVLHPRVSHSGAWAGWQFAFLKSPGDAEGLGLRSAGTGRAAVEFCGAWPSASILLNLRPNL